MKTSAWIMRRAVPLVALGAALAIVPLAASPAVADDGGRPFVTVMTGSQEPNGGDLDGIGVAALKVNSGQEQICYLLAVAMIDGTVTAAHIHRAPAGVNGPIVVPLQAPTTGVSAACATVAQDLAKDIRQNPENFYVNVHSSVFPGGAVRGQLG